MSRSFVIIAPLVVSVLMALVLPGNQAFVARPALVASPKSVQTQRLSVAAGQLVAGSNGLADSIRRTSVLMATTEGGDQEKSKLPFFLDPGTKGGAVFLSLVVFIVPLILYNISLSMGLDMIDANRIFGVGFTVVLSLAWVSTYIFRVATKDMTYAKQLKDYENAVMQKRLEELDEDEVQALLEEVDRDEF